LRGSDRTRKKQIREERVQFFVNTNPVVFGFLVMKMYMSHYIYELKDTSRLRLVSYEGENLRLTLTRKPYRRKFLFVC
jgi:hypothetical protein